MYIVYKATSPSGKVYIGITKNSLRQRIASHYSYAKSGKNTRPFACALNKYTTHFSWEILEKELDRDQAEFLEKYYIRVFNSQDRSYGYNLSPGGLSGSVQSEEGRKSWKAKMSALMKNPEYKKKITDHLKTPEHRAKIKMGFEKFKKENPEHYNILNKNRSKRSSESSRKAAISMGGKPFFCVETGEVFYFLQEAADRFGAHKDSIYKVLKGKRKTYKKLHFKYVDQERVG